MTGTPDDLPSPGADLPVWPTAAAALRFGFSMVNAAAVAGVVTASLVALMMLIGAAPMPGEGPTAAGGLNRLGPVSDVILLGVSFALTAVFTVFFHRRVMLAHDASVRVRLSRREGRFLIASVLYTLALFVPGVIVMLGARAAAGNVPQLTYVAAMAVGALILFLFVRFALAFPAVAVDAPGSLLDQFKYSYIATRGRFGRLFAVYAVAYLIFMVIVMVAGMGLALILAGIAAGGASPILLAWIGLAVQITLQFIALAVFASIASRAFMAWSGWRPPVPPEADAA